MTDKVFLSADFDSQCGTCGHSPTVTIKKSKDKYIVAESDMFGACYFGDAEMIDAALWNSTK